MKLRCRACDLSTDLDALWNLDSGDGSMAWEAVSAILCDYFAPVGSEQAACSWCCTGALKICSWACDRRSRKLPALVNSERQGLLPYTMYIAHA